MTHAPDIDGAILAGIALVGRPELRATPDGATAIPRRVRSDSAPVLAYTRDLTPQDIASLAEPGPVQQPAKTIAKLRASHHSLARLLAQGTSDVEASAITSYDAGTIYKLRADPTFQELLAYYKDQVQGQYLDVHSRLATLGTTAVEMLQEKLDTTEPTDIPYKVLREIGEFALDRSIAPAKGGPRGPANNTSGFALNVSFVAPPPRPDDAPSPKPMIDVTPQD
jgi:hypothetical protein